MDDSTAKILIGLVGTLAGAGLSGIIKIVITAREKCSQHKSLLAALTGEISAIVDITFQLSMVNEVKDVLNRISSTGTPEHLELTVRQNYFRVYEKYLDKLGMLDVGVTGKICRFYTLCFAAVEYLNELSTDEWLEHRKNNIVSVCADMETLIALIIKVQEDGSNLIRDLENEVPEITIGNHL